MTRAAKQEAASLLIKHLPFPSQHRYRVFQVELCLALSIEPQQSLGVQTSVQLKVSSLT